MADKIRNEKDYLFSLNIEPVRSELDRAVYLGMSQLYRYERIKETSLIELYYERNNLIKDLRAKINNIKWLIDNNDICLDTLSTQLINYEKELSIVQKIDSIEKFREYLLSKEASFIITIKEKLDQNKTDYNGRYLMMLGSVMFKGKKKEFERKCLDYNKRKNTPIDDVSINIDNLDLIADSFWNNHLLSVGTREKIKRMFSNPISNFEDLEAIKDIVSEMRAKAEELDGFGEFYFTQDSATQVNDMLIFVNVKDQFFLDNSFNSIVRYFNEILIFIDIFSDFLNNDSAYISQTLEQVKLNINKFKTSRFKYLLRTDEKICDCLEINNALRILLKNISDSYSKYLIDCFGTDFDKLLVTERISVKWEEYISNIIRQIDRIEDEVISCERKLANKYLTKEHDLSDIMLEARKLAGSEFDDFDMASLECSDSDFEKGYVLYLCSRIISKYGSDIRNCVLDEVDAREADLKNISLSELRASRLLNSDNTKKKSLKVKKSLYR